MTAGTTTTSPRVLILGGGFVALHACRALRKPIEAGLVEVTVVSRENFLFAHGMIAEMVTGRISASHILNPARRIFAPAQVHVAEVERVDLERRQVVASRSIDGARSTLAYDHLVIALGSADRLDAYPGLAEHAFRLKSFEDCFRLKNHLVRMFELADVEHDPDERRRLLTFFIAGGGFAGSEVAGELADFARLLTSREYSGIALEECRFVLVEPGPAILPELQGDHGSGPHAHPRLVEFAAGHLRELGVEVMTGTSVAAATPNEVTLSNGDRIPTRTIVSAVGARPTPLVAGLDLPKDERGRIQTDRTLRVPGHDGLWAGGDCAAVPKPGRGTSPAVATHAMAHGGQIGRNIARLVEGKPLRPYRFPGIGQGASLGRRTGVGAVGPIEIRGWLAWFVWRALLTYVFPSRDRQLRLLADWAIWPLVGRDIVEMQGDVAGNYEVRHNVFQPGEVLASEVRTGKYIHIIVEGEVEILHQRAGMEQLLATLGPGDHFGTRWVESFELETARAKTLVRTVALRRDQAPRLQEVLSSAGRLVAESGHFPAIVDQAPPAAGAGGATPSGTPPKP